MTALALCPDCARLRALGLHADSPTPPTARRRSPSRRRAFHWSAPPWSSAPAVDPSAVNPDLRCDAGRFTLRSDLAIRCATCTVKYPASERACTKCGAQREAA